VLKGILVAALSSALLSGTVFPSWGQLPAPQHYESSSPQSTCNVNTYPCRLNFKQTPSTSRVLIRMVSCRIEANVAITTMTLGAATSTVGGIVKTVNFGAAPQIVDNMYFYSFSAPVHFYIGQDRVPFYSIASQKSGTANTLCSISGDLESP
jgi:hypothetical protein